MPFIDLDIEHHYVESSTKGHAHLYLNKQLTTEEYRKLLTVLVELGIIGKGNLEQLDRDGCCSFRLPGVKKEQEKKDNVYSQQQDGSWVSIGYVEGGLLG